MRLLENSRNGIKSLVTYFNSFSHGIFIFEELVCCLAGEHNGKWILECSRCVAVLQVIFKKRQHIRIGEETRERNIDILVFNRHPTITKSSAQPHGFLDASVICHKLASNRQRACRIPLSVRYVTLV